MVAASFAEIISIGAVLPFLAILTAPIRIFEHPFAQPFITMLGITTPEQLLLPLTIIFSAAVLLAGATRILLLWASTHLSYATGADLSISIYRRTLYQPYMVHVARNSSEIISGITNKTSNVINTLMMVLNLIGSSVILAAIMIALVSIDHVMALVTVSGFGLIYALIIRFTRNKLVQSSQLIATKHTQVIKALQEGLGGIRDVLVDGSQPTYCKIYRSADLPLREAQSVNVFMSSCPRYGMEALGMLFIAILAYMLAQQEDGLSKAIPILGTLALGAQRLLPVLQQGYSAWSSILGGHTSLEDTLDLLDQPLPWYLDQQPTNALSFQYQIVLNRVSFRYSPHSPLVLDDFSLTIPKGSRVGFIGKTGSGKSTLLDIIMGLLKPTIGTLEVDGQPITDHNLPSWQANIAHVPQAIFLADSTIEENIAFGIPAEKIDHERVRHAAEQAQIADIIETWPKQYQTIIGERGIRLSGGQRQRIGIARALYKQANVIIFDEATSALDHETEQSVMHSIESLNETLTILIIAHRLTTLKSCKQIVEL